MNLIQVGLGYQQLRASMPAMNAPLLLRAAGVLLEATTVAEQVGDARMRSYADGYLGHLYETEYRYDEALQLTRRAVFSAQSANAPESLFRWQWQLGRLLAATGKLDEAIASYGHATTTLRPIRMEVASAWGNDSFSGEDSVRALFFELADLLLQRASLTDDSQGAETVSAQRARRDRNLQGRRVTGLLPGRLCGHPASAYHEAGHSWPPERPWCIPSSSRIDWNCWSASPMD